MTALNDCIWNKAKRAETECYLSAFRGKADMPYPPRVQLIAGIMLH